MSAPLIDADAPVASVTLENLCPTCGVAHAGAPHGAPDAIDTSLARACNALVRVHSLCESYDCVHNAGASCPFATA